MLNRTCGHIVFVDNVAAPLVTETWTVALNASSRRLSLSIAGRALRKASLRAVRHGLYLRATSIHGLFSRGVVQMKWLRVEMRGKRNDSFSCGRHTAQITHLACLQIFPVVPGFCHGLFLD
jgi:hypothetical protein